MNKFLKNKFKNIFESIKLIKHYIFFNKIKIFSMFDVSHSIDHESAILIL